MWPCITIGIIMLALLIRRWLHNRYDLQIAELTQADPRAIRRECTCRDCREV